MQKQLQCAFSRSLLLKFHLKQSQSRFIEIPPVIHIHLSNATKSKLRDYFIMLNLRGKILRNCYSNSKIVVTILKTLMAKKNFITHIAPSSNCNSMWRKGKLAQTHSKKTRYRKSLTRIMRVKTSFLSYLNLAALLCEHLL